MSTDAALPDDGEARIEAFRAMLEAARAPGAVDNPVLLSNRLVGEEAGDLLRCCAVPHEFDCELLAFMGQLAPEEAEERYAQFTELSLMQIGASSLSVHERWRAPLWQWWLAAAQRARFGALSARLVEWFTRPADPSGEDTMARRRMFHLLGCRHDEGMAEFDRLFRVARHRRRFSECSLLLKLVREYEPALAPAERALLSYHEGKIAIDLRQWERALPPLRAAAEDPQAGARLRVNAQARIANAMRNLGQSEQALGYLHAARSAAEQNPATELSRWRLLYELGEVERDLGRYDLAAETLKQALALTRHDDDEADLAGVLNSLGTVQLKQRDTEAALDSLNKSLVQLRQQGDALRPATVLNNLGLVQLERCDWAAAESAFAESLGIKRNAGDRLGQATTLLNLGRAQAAQGRVAQAQLSVGEAQRLFESEGDARGLALAAQAALRLNEHAKQNIGGHDAVAADQGFPKWAWVLIGLGLTLLALIAAIE